MEPATCPSRAGGYQSLTCRNFASGTVENYYAEPLEQKLPLRQWKMHSWNVGGIIVASFRIRRVRGWERVISGRYEQGFPVWNWTALGSSDLLCNSRRFFFNRTIQLGGKWYDSFSSSSFFLFFFFFNENKNTSKGNNTVRDIFI